MVEAAVALRRQERMFVQPCGGGEDLRFRNHRVALAVSVEHRNVQLRDAVIGGRASRDDARCEEARQRNRSAVTFRMHAQQMNGQQAALRKADWHHGAVGRHVLGHPIVDGHRRGIGVAVQILPGRHAIVEP